MDLSETIAPTSDQLDAVDLLTGPRTFTVRAVDRGNAEQPVNIHLTEFPRPWRPGKSMRRVLVACWGPDASTYVGRRVTLFLDPDVTFGKDRTGGTRISHLSHIDKPTKVPLLVSRGKSAMFTVQPLPDVQAPAKLAGNLDVATITDRDVLKDLWRTADQQTRAAIKARVDQLDAAAPADDPLDYSGDLLDEGGAPR